MKMAENMGFVELQNEAKNVGLVCSSNEEQGTIYFRLYDTDKLFIRKFKTILETYAYLMGWGDRKRKY